MNLLLISSCDFISASVAQINDRRLTHLQEINRVKLGDCLKVGQLDGAMGSGKVIALDANSISLEVSLQSPPPPPLPMILILALPRPKMVKRILQTVASLGVKELYLINSFRVDKSYWSSPVLNDQAIQEQLFFGLEQAGDTAIPQVHLRKRFKPFVEDELPALAKDRAAWIAHPKAEKSCPQPSNKPCLLAVGPEGGFIPYEVDLMSQQGLTPFQIGPRILRVETAVPVLLTRLFPLM